MGVFSTPLAEALPSLAKDITVVEVWDWKGRSEATVCDWGIGGRRAQQCNNGRVMTWLDRFSRPREPASIGF